MKLFLDASAISAKDRCDEFYRLGHVPQTVLGEHYQHGIEEIRPNIYYAFGTATHTFVEAFWKGEQDQNRLTDIYFECANKYPVQLLNPAELETWKRMVSGIPDLVAAYLDAVEYEPEKLLWVEQEWSYPYGRFNSSSSGNHPESSVADNHIDSSNAGVNSGGMEVILCGRMDRTMIGPSLVDVKTASEIASGGVPWKQAYREEKLLEPQFGLYDWFMQRKCKCGHPDYDHMGLLGSDDIHAGACHFYGDCGCTKFQSMAPKEVYLEVLLKPYKSKAARLEKIYLNEIVTPAYRKRFEQQLAFKVAEIVRYYRDYSEQKPWPQNANACKSVYGRCPFHAICCFGESPKTMAKFGRRVPHLDLVRLGS